MVRSGSGLVTKISKISIFERKMCMSEKTWKCKILASYALCGELSEFFRPRRGPRAGRPRPLDMTNVACRDDPFIVSRIVQAIFSFTGASKRNFGRKEKIKSDDTFWFITLVPPDGFRYRFVNVELKHEGLIWFEPWCPENLLRTDRGIVKVRVGDYFFSKI